MKKILLLALALLMVVSFASCNKPPKGTESSNIPETSAEPTDTSTQPADTTDPDQSSSTPSAEDEMFVKVNETVYVYGTTALNIRESYSTQSKKVGEMKEGEQVTRTGIAATADAEGIIWSRILYKDGKTYYASSAYLTTAAPMTFTDKSATMYAGADPLKLYLKPSLNADCPLDLGYGTEVSLTGVSQNADEAGKYWSRLLVNGTVYYVPSENLIEKTDVGATLTFNSVNETVRITADSLKLREDASLNSLVITTVVNGTELTRTGIATTTDADGIVWSRVVYNGRVCYASSTWLTNEKKVADSLTFTEVKETVYVTAETSLSIRDDASLDSTIIAYVTHGTALERTGIEITPASSGILWSRVIYNGRVCYASSAYLSTTPPAAE